MKNLALVIFVGGTLFAGDLKIVSDLSGVNTRYRRMIGIIGDAEFISMASKLLDPKEVTLGMVAAYGSPSDVVLAGPRGYESGSYEDWRFLIDRYDQPRSGCPAVQQAIKIGSAVIFRGVDRNCRRSSRLLQGKASPLELVVAGNRVDVLEMSFPYILGKSKQRWFGVQLYVRTRGVVSLELARAITVHLRAATGVTELFLGLRSDIWFFDKGSFPAWFPFESMSKLPSKEEFLRGRYVGCGAFDNRPIQCF